MLAEHDPEGRGGADPSELQRVQQTLIDTLGQFGIAVAPGDITKGPTITRYEVYPAKGVRVDKIVSLERDLARATRAERINILAPIPGKDTVGIELANTRKVTVTLRELLESTDWEEAKAHSKIPLALGKDVYGKAIITDLAQMPHLLVAGTTGAGKSVCINALIASMLFRFTPEELRFIMIDPKVVELQHYNALPHLAFPVVTDPKKVLLALRWLIDEMERRYKMFARVGARNIISFNARPKKKVAVDLVDDAVEENASPARTVSPAKSPNAAGTVATTEEKIPIPERIPYVVVVIDELADLMQTAPADVESAIARITQMARAAGIHLIVATQTPRADVITGVIKANIPSRIAFQVASKIDSRVILDENGADRLLGQGDMLYLPPSASRLIRAQGVLVTDGQVPADLVRDGRDAGVHTQRPQDAARHAYRHVIINVVGGSDPGVQVEVHKLPLEAGDRLLLCSDGLTEMVADEEVQAVLQAEPVPQSACRRLIDRANENGGKDNVTVVVAHFE